MSRQSYQVKRQNLYRGKFIHGKKVSSGVNLKELTNWNYFIVVEDSGFVAGRCHFYGGAKEEEISLLEKISS